MIVDWAIANAYQGSKCAHYASIRRTLQSIWWRVSRHFGNFLKNAAITRMVPSTLWPAYRKEYQYTTQYIPQNREYQSIYPPIYICIRAVIKLILYRKMRYFIMKSTFLFISLRDERVVQRNRLSIYYGSAATPHVYMMNIYACATFCVTDIRTRIRIRSFLHTVLSHCWEKYGWFQARYIFSQDYHACGNVGLNMYVHLHVVYVGGANTKIRIVRVVQRPRFGIVRDVRVDIKIPFGTRT
jgi:hypothetical protein